MEFFPVFSRFGRMRIRAGVQMLTLFVVCACASLPESARSQHVTPCFTWSDNDTAGVFDKLIPMVWVGTFSGNNLYTVNNIPGVLSALNAQPAGRRSLFLFNIHYRMHQNANDVILDSLGTVQGYTDTLGNFHAFPPVWWDNGTDSVYTVYEHFFYQLDSAGASLDYVVVDYEVSVSNWTMDNFLVTAAVDSGDKDSILLDYYMALDNDPRFDSLKTVMGITDITNVYDWWSHPTDYLRFNEVMWDLQASYLSHAVYDAVVPHFPQVVVSNYFNHRVSGDYPVPDVNGHYIYCCGNDGNYIGNRQSTSFYGALGWILEDIKPPGGLAHFPLTPFNACLFEINKMRAMRYADTVAVSPWIAYYSFEENDAIRFDSTDYYAEMIFHLLLSGSREILFWNPRAILSAPSAGEVAESQLVNDILDQYDDFWSAAPPDRSLIEVDSVFYPFDASSILTGMESDSLVVWRFTPSMDSSQVIADFIYSVSPPVFIAGNDTITFPPGSYLFTPASVLSAAGLWVVLEKNTTGLSSAETPPCMLQLFPDPASDHVTIRLMCERASADVRYTVTDCTGRIMVTGIMNTQDVRLPVHLFKPGLYFVCVQNQNFVINDRVILQR